MRRCALTSILVLSACAADAGGGRIETLAPILGGGAMVRPPTTEAREPVEDHWTDLGDFTPAWPSVSYELPRLIQSSIARGTWTDEHHVAENVGTGLHVRHRPDVVKETRRLLDHLRALMIRPLDVEVAFVEIPAQLAADRWDMAGFRALVAKNEARELGRIALSTYSGQWTSGERMTNQSVLIGVAAEAGAVVPRSVVLASGISVQAAAWRWGEERAVLALTGLMTGEAAGGVSIAQQVHRALPEKRKNHREWEPHEVNLELPVRTLIEAQTQVTVARGEWTSVAVVPSSPDRVFAALARVDWSSPAPAAVKIDPHSNSGYVLEVIPIALPTEYRPDDLGRVDVDNKRTIEENAAGWLRQRAQSSAESQKKATYNFQEESGSLDLNAASQAAQGIRRKGGEPKAAAASLPEDMALLTAEIMSAEWPAGTGLEFVGNHVFVVQTPELVQKLRALLDATHAWSNRVIPVEVSFLEIGALSGATPAKPFLPPARLLTRPGSWTDVFAGEMHAVLAAAWPADHSSPPVQVYWRGTRLAARPLANTDKTTELQVSSRRYSLERLAPVWIGKAVIQLPVDSLWSLDRRLRLDPGQSTVTGLAGTGEGIHAIGVRRLD